MNSFQRVETKCQFVQDAGSRVWSQQLVSEEERLTLGQQVFNSIQGVPQLIADVDFELETKG